MLIRNWQVVLQTDKKRRDLSFLLLSLPLLRKDIDQWKSFAFGRSRLVRGKCERRKRKIAKEMNITTRTFLIISLSLHCHCRREKNEGTTLAEKSTSSIHQHCRRYFCLVECVNFKKRKRSLQHCFLFSSSSFYSNSFLIFFFSSLNKHIFSISMTRWSVVWLQLPLIHLPIDNYFFSSDDFPTDSTNKVAALMAKQEHIDPIAYYAHP